LNFNRKATRYGMLKNRVKKDEKNIKKGVDKGGGGSV
jgi:hypothetical protein